MLGNGGCDNWGVQGPPESHQGDPVGTVDTIQLSLMQDIAF